MEREITLSSFPARDVKANRPGDFTTKFYPEIDLSDRNASYSLAFNRIISKAFSWTNINSGYNNQKIAFSKDAGRTFTDINQALIVPYLTCGLTVWGQACKSYPDKLLRLQKRALRFLYFSDHNEHAILYLLTLISYR